MFYLTSVRAYLYETQQGEVVVELVDVADFLQGHGLQDAQLNFLSNAPDRITILLVQPKGTIDATTTKLAISNPEVMAAKMTSFVELASTSNVDIAVCPEYSCPWEALLASVEGGMFPRQGALWALCCESITPGQLEAAKERASNVGLTVLQPPIALSAGHFLNCLCYLFIGSDQEGQEVRILLIQPKTSPMGGTDYERDSLIPGNTIFRFGQQNSNRLVFLVCSDVLGEDFKNNIVPSLNMDTFLFHLQLNKDSAAEGFREYRDRCCNILPRTTEILCLNWAKGTSIRAGGKTLVTIDEPKSIYYRVAEGIRARDEDIVANHRNGIFLSYWEQQRTAAYIFSPDEQVFRISTSKPVMRGAAAAVGLRTGPKAEARYEWRDDSWCLSEEDSNDRYAEYLHNYAQLETHLEPYANKHIDMERLVQFSTGFGLDENWYDWKSLVSFRLANDDTSGRLRLCWSEQGDGAQHRLESFKRLRALLFVVDDASARPVRLSVLKDKPIALSYNSTPQWQRIRNLKSGENYATAVYLGADPSAEILDITKRKLDKRLYDFDQDTQRLSILYRDHTGALKDHMDSFTPAVNDDPAADPASITSS